MHARGWFPFASLAFVVLAACGGSGLYDPITVGEIEAGKVPPGLAELDEHVAIPGSVFCIPHDRPTKCFYRAAPKEGEQAKRQAGGATAGRIDDDAHQTVLVRFEPGAEKDPGFASRPKVQGRFVRIAMLPTEDQRALALEVDVRHTVFFLADTGQAGWFGGGGKIAIPLLVGLAAAAGFLVWILRRASRGEGRGGSPAYVPVAIGPTTVAPAPAAPPEPLAPSAPSLAPGAQVVIRRDNGSQVDATILQASPGRYQCDLGEGRKAWVAADRVRVRG